jgi:hypothetical protein
MSASDILFGSIKRDIINLFKDPTKVSIIPRDDIRKSLEYAIDAHQKFVTTFSILTTDELFQLKERFQKKVSTNPNSFTSRETVKIINRYFDGLGSTGRMLDRKLGPFSSLNKVSSELYKILLKIKTRFDEYISTPFVTISDARLSTISILQFINMSELVCTYSEYIFSLIFDTVSDYITPKYRWEYMNQHHRKFLKFMNEILERNGVYDLVKNIDNMRKDGSDVLLMYGSVPNSFAFINKVGSAIKSFFIADNSSPMKGIGLFRRIGEVYDQWLHSRYEKNEKRLNWMQERVALFKADMQGLSPDSAEYQKLRKIVEVYDQEITKVDKKINTYLNEE